MPRKIKRIGGVALGESFLIEHPVIEIAAIAMNKNDGRSPCLTDLQETQTGAAGIDGFGFGTGVAGGRVPIEIVIEFLDVSLDRRLIDRGRCDNAEQRPHRHGRAGFDHDLPERAGDRAFIDIGDLGGLDVHDVLAGFDLGARFDKPRRDHALLHRETPFRHDNRLDAHVCFLTYVRSSHRAAPRPTAYRVVGRGAARCRSNLEAQQTSAAMPGNPKVSRHPEFNALCRPPRAPPPRYRRPAGYRYPRAPARTVPAHEVRSPA